MKKLKNIGQLFMTLVMLLTSVFSNAFVVYADTNPNAGKVTATKTAERIGDETSRSAKVKITVSGNPYTLTTQKEREIVLVLDASGSMTNGISGSNKNRIETLKDAAVNFIDNLLTEENAGKVKIGVVWYAEKSNTLASDACQLSDNAQTLKNCVSNKKASGGTNVQLGISIAKNLFTTADNEKSLIVLSDGEPTFYNDKNGVEHGSGRADAHENMYAYDFVATRNYQNNKGQWVSDGYIEYYDYNSEETYTCEYVGYKRDWNGTTYESVTCPEGFNMKPSEAAQKEVSSFNGKIYSIGFGITSKDVWGNTVTNTAAESFLKSIVKNGGRYFDASDSAKLNEAFAAVSKDMDVVAKDLTIKDVVPSTFTVDENDLKQRYGNNVTITKDENTKETIITYKFAELSSKKPEELTFNVTANEDYYGSMYTNNGATVTGTAADGNKFYENVDGKINENLIDPVAPIASRTKDDKYETKTNEELVVNTNDGIKSNDYKGKQEDEAKSVLDEIIIVNETKYGSLELNQDGSLKYNPNTNFRGTDNFTYYIKTTITDKEGNKTYAKSNTSTVTITVNGVKTSYIVNYLEKGTNKKVADSKTISKNANNGDLYIGDKVTEYALTLNNYNLVGNSQESITLAKEGNVINFYYELKDSKIVVHYIEKDTNTKLADDDTFDGKVTETKVINAIDINDYVVVGSKVQDAVFDLTTNEYTFYYEKAESAGAVAHHYIIDNNGNKTTDKLFNDDTASGKIGKTFSFSPKTEGLGEYEFVESEGTTSGVLTSEIQEVTFYYQLKMTDVTVRYVTIKDGNVIDLIKPVKDTGRISDDYTAYAKDETDDAVFANYNLESATEQTIKLKSSDNTITFIYKLKDSKIVVHYVEKDTKTKLADDDTFDGKVTETKVINAKDIKDYVVVGSKVQDAVFDLTTNEYTFYYEKAESAGAVAHHYIIDNNGNKTTDKLFNDDTANGKIGKTFSFSPKTEGLGDYEYVESEGKTSGTLTSEKQEVTFYYQLKMTNVTVRYVTIKDGNVIDLIKPVKDTGRINDNYTAYAKDKTDDTVFANYNLESATEQTIKLKSSDNTITFIYKLKDSKIVVHYIEKDTNAKLAGDDTFDGKVTETKVINAKDIKDYVVVGSNVQDAVFGLTTNEYTFFYEKAESAGAVAHHYIIDNNGNKTTDKLFNDDTASGKIGKNFSFSPKTEGLGDYEYVESEGTTSGALTSEKQEVTFYYQLKMTNVTVRYVTIKDGNVTDLIKPVKDNGRINDDYTAYAKDETDDAVFANYNLESATEQTIKLKSSDNTIRFIYKLKDSKIVVHYVEKGTKKTLEPDKEFPGKVTDKFEISAINIPKYTAVDTTSYNGEYTLETKEYTFYYEKNESAGAIAHHYIIDENGNKTTDKLFEDDTISGKLDKEYSFSAKTDLGAYEFVESTGNTSGVLTEEVQEATFYYKLRDAKVIVHHYEEGTTIKIAADETINGKVSKDYTTKEADVYGYILVSTPENASGMFTDEVTEVIYYYKKDMGKVITKYVDEDGKVLLEETTTNGQVGTDYQTSPATITDYELINTIGEVKGKYTKEDIIVTYVYQFVMGEGGDDANVEPDIPYTGIEGDSYLLEYSLMGTSALGLILLAILKKKFN